MTADEVGREDFAPCPTCHQYSHSISDDALAKAHLHFETMYAHPVRGHPMGRVFDDQTRDAAQLLVAEARHASPLRTRIAELEDVLASALQILDEIDEYQKRPESGSYDAECACCMGELLDEYRGNIGTMRATLNGEKKDG